MRTSFLLTSLKRFDKDVYLIPGNVRVGAIRLKSAIINLNEKNVVGHKAYLSVGSVNDEIPVNDPQEFILEDGTYTPEQYCQMLQDRLNGEKSDINASTLWERPVQWEIKFNQASGKIEFRAYINNNFEYNVFLWFNDAASDYISTGSPVTHNNFLKWHRYGGEDNFRTTPGTVLLYPRYYRICSNRLINFGFIFDNSIASNIIGIVPIDWSRKWTTWESNDDFFHSREELVRLDNLMDIQIFLEESATPLENPEFALTFQIET
jgi:hypothetical protein